MAILNYIEGLCTCGTPYKVFVKPQPYVFRLTESVVSPPDDLNEPHTVVFFCTGCDRNRTVQYNDSDVKQETIPDENATHQSK